MRLTSTIIEVKIFSKYMYLLRSDISMKLSATETVSTKFENYSVELFEHQINMRCRTRLSIFQ